MKQEELVIEALSKATGAAFEVVQLPPDYPIPIKDIDWFVRCRRLEDIQRTPYLNTAWKEKDGNIWLESLVIGDTINWIESEYGEEEAGKSLKIDYSDFLSERFQTEFASKYPLVRLMIQEHETAAARVSKIRDVSLEFRHTISKGLVVFSFAAKIADSDIASLGKRIEKNVEALKEAYEEVDHDALV